MHQHILDFFWPTHYVSINKVLNVRKNCHFPNPPTQSFCWRNIGMVPTIILVFLNKQFYRSDLEKWRLKKVRSQIHCFFSISHQSQYPRIAIDGVEIYLALFFYLSPGPRESKRNSPVLTGQPTAAFLHLITSSIFVSRHTSPWKKNQLIFYFFNYQKSLASSLDLNEKISEEIG